MAFQDVSTAYGYDAFGSRVFRSGTRHRSGGSVLDEKGAAYGALIAGAAVSLHDAHINAPHNLNMSTKKIAFSTVLVLAGTAIDAAASSDSHVEKILPCTSTLQSTDRGVVKDLCTHLMWQQDDSATPLDWQQAGLYCSNLTLAGRRDWRLPTINELTTIIDYSTDNPANYHLFHFSAPTSTFRLALIEWSSTLDFGSRNIQNNPPTFSRAWAVDFETSRTGAPYKTDQLNARCVRTALDNDNLDDGDSN